MNRVLIKYYVAFSTVLEFRLLILKPGGRFPEENEEKNRKLKGCEVAILCSR
jgi:hypothetical protein